MNEIRIGAIEQFSEWPSEITCDGKPYWLTQQEDGGYKLLLAVCPHAGGEVRLAAGALYCPLHFWTFDAKDGRCTSEDDERLMQRDVQVLDGILYAVGEDY